MTMVKRIGIIRGMNSTKKNFIYNTAYQILILILPLITVPYISRILGAEKIGIYSYTYSIVHYFMLIAMLGINNYGNRTIAKVRDNKTELSKNFLGIYTIQLFLSFFMIIIYVVFVFIAEPNYRLIAYIQIIFLISNAIDVNWFFFGMEKFKITVTRNTIIKIISLLCIFLFVKSQQDLPIYTIIMASSTFLSQLVLVFFIRRYIKKVKISFSDITKHIKPCLILFIPVIAVSIYKIMDKIMIEKLYNVTEVGYYEQAEKIINMPTSLITALGTVMLPKISNLVKKNENEKIRNYIAKSFKFMSFLAYPMIVGLVLTAKNIVTILLGYEFNNSILIIQLLASTILFISFANIIRTQYLIPMEKDKIYIISVILGAIINLISNFIFIPLYGAYGACIGTILAEFVVMFYQFIKVRKEITVFKNIKSSLIFLLTSIIMGVIILLLGKIDCKIYIKLVLQIVVGALVYGILNYKYIFSIIDVNKILKKRKG